MKRKSITLALVASIAAASAQERIAVTYDKTVHMVFPQRIVYVDLGSDNIIAKAVPEKPNILRLKAANRGFQPETNLSVILEDDSIHCFDVHYTDSLEKAVHILSHEESVPSEAEGILSRNAERITGMGDIRHDMGLALKSIYCTGKAIYFHLRLASYSSIPYDTEAVILSVDQKRNIRSGESIGEELTPVETAGVPHTLRSGGSWDMVIGVAPFTLRENELLKIEVLEKNGRRHIGFYLGGRTLSRNMENL